MISCKKNAMEMWKTSIVLYPSLYIQRRLNSLSYPNFSRPNREGGAGYESVITLCSDKNWLHPGLLIRISQTTYNSKPSPRYIYPKVVKRKNENERFEPVSVRVKTLVLGQHR